MLTFYMLVIVTEYIIDIVNKEGRLYYILPCGETIRNIPVLYCNNAELV